MPDDTRTVDVPIPVETSVAAALSGERARVAVGRLVSRVLRPHVGADELAEAIAEAKAEAGLADAGSAAERAAAGKAFAAEFREFRCGRTLGGLDSKALIREGLR